MAIFNEQQVWDLFYSNLTQAGDKLAEIEVLEGRKPEFADLSEWVFEQTIKHCVLKELDAKGVKAELKEQVSLSGRVKADFSLGTVAIELETSGPFDIDDAEEFGKYKNDAEAQRFQHYLYLTWEEIIPPCREDLDHAVGKTNVFHLKDSGEWQRLISFICEADTSLNGWPATTLDSTSLHQ